MHSFEWEDKEFRGAMRGQVSTTFSILIAGIRWDLLKMSTGTGIITQCTTGKKSKFRLCLPLSGINFYGD